MSDSVDSVIEGFPYSTIEKHIGEPKFQLVKDVERKLVKNVSSHPSELGGGNRRYFGLLLQTIKYTLVTGQDFTPHPTQDHYQHSQPTQPNLK